MSQMSREDVRERLGNIDQIRDIIFGTQLREYENQFSKLESDISVLQQEMRSHVAQLKTNFATELRTAVKSLEKKLKSLNITTQEDAADLRQQVDRFNRKFSSSVQTLDEALDTQTTSIQNELSGPLQQGKDGMNAAFYTGTNAMLRREALISVGLQYFSDEFAKDEKRLDEFELVGGVSSNSITEDMNTAMRLHSAGCKSIYHNELLAEGLAPDDLSSTLKQRLRWAQGTIQVLLRENPVTKPGLTFWQRLHYFKTMYSYFSGFATLIFISCPIIYFFTGIIPVKTYSYDFALHFFPFFTTITLKLLNRKKHDFDIKKV